MRAEALHRLVRSLLAHGLDAGCDDPPNGEDLARFAARHRLDLQDLAALVAVASGERIDPTPPTVVLPPRPEAPTPWRIGDIPIPPTIYPTPSQPTPWKYASGSLSLDADEATS